MICLWQPAYRKKSFLAIRKSWNSERKKTVLECYLFLKPDELLFFQEAWRKARGKMHRLFLEESVWGNIAEEMTSVLRSSCISGILSTAYGYSPWAMHLSRDYAFVQRFRFGCWCFWGILRLFCHCFIHPKSQRKQMDDDK